MSMQCFKTVSKERAIDVCNMVNQIIASIPGLRLSMSSQEWFDHFMSFDDNAPKKVDYTVEGNYFVIRATPGSPLAGVIKMLCEHNKDNIGFWECTDGVFSYAQEYFDLDPGVCSLVQYYCLVHTKPSMDTTRSQINSEYKFNMGMTALLSLIKQFASSELQRAIEGPYDTPKEDWDNSILGFF